MEKKIKKTKCTDCKYYLRYSSTSTQKNNGILLRPGERYCLGAKKSRLFKPHDSKVYPPAWCPRHKKPSELKVYCYKDLPTAMLREQIRSSGIFMSPNGYEYALRYHGMSPVSAYEFQNSLKNEYVWNILDQKVYPYEVIEIDNGIVSYFFYVMEEKVECINSFNRAKALENVLVHSERSDDFGG